MPTAPPLSSRTHSSTTIGGLWAAIPPDEVRTAVERIFEQYSQFEGQTLAVRGDTLQLARSRWSNEAGYETTYLHVTEIDGDGRISYYGRFDEDDFEGAYRELDQRYYAGEGAAFAEAGTAQTEWMIALNRGDLDRVFGELTAPGHALRNPFEFSVS